MDIIDQLRRHSARWASDPLLVQGAGGNTSVKIGDRMWIKASGKQLADALNSNIFVEVPSSDGNRNELRPSIETSLHALLPHRIVVHFHMIEVLAFAVRGDGRAALSQRLSGLNWIWVGYHKPGPHLSNAVQEALAPSAPDIIVLGNHGVVIGADNFTEINDLLAELRRRVDVHPRSVEPDLKAIQNLASDTGLQLPSDAAIHSLACDPEAFRVASAGSLYPDHVVFLGRGVGLSTSDASPLIVIKDVGVLLANGLGHQAQAMVACLAALAARVAPGAPLRPLTRFEEDKLITWEAEAHRRTVAA